MKTTVIIAIVVVAGVTAFYFYQISAHPMEDKVERLILNSETYEAAAEDVARQINDISPTPSTEDSWTAREIEFVKGEPYAYIVYHDTHNIFRILVETGTKPYAKENHDTYRTIATFEADKTGWRLSGGEDLAKGKETVIIKPN